jgi:hypothetical protein
MIEPYIIVMNEEQGLLERSESSAEGDESLHFKGNRLVDLPP